MLKMGVFWNETRQDLNKMVDMAKIGGQKDRPDAENGGQNCSAYLLTLKEPGSLLAHQCFLVEKLHKLYLSF